MRMDIFNKQIQINLKWQLDMFEFMLACTFIRTMNWSYYTSIKHDILFKSLWVWVGKCNMVKTPSNPNVQFNISRNVSQEEKEEKFP